MNHFLRMACLLVALAVSTAPVKAEESFRVEPVGAHQGLDTGILSTVFVDRQGFLWTATGSGLIRFDGYSTIIFTRDPSDPTSISDNIVRTIHEDRSGRLWVGTNSGGLNLLDRLTGTFTHYRHDPTKPGSISNDSVLAIVEDRDGTLWVGTQNGLNRFDPATGSFERLMADVDDPQRPSNDEINAIHEDSQGMLWIATNGGLNRRDPGTGRFTRFGHDPHDPHSIDDDEVFALAEDGEGALWVGTRSGVNHLDTDGQTFRRYTAEFHHLESPMMVYALAVGPSGSVWIGTFGSGLFALNSRTGETRSGRHQDQGTGRASRILVLHATNDALYAATWGDGLKRVQFGAVPVNTVPPDTDPLSLRDVSAILEDRHGTLWLGAYGSGLRKREPGEGEFRALDLPGVYTFAIAESEADDLWYGGEEGLGRINRRTGESSFFVHAPQDSQSLGAGFVTALLVDSDGQVWVGTSEAGLQRLLADGQSFEQFVHDPANPSSISDNYVTQLYEDIAGELWIGTRAGGLNACDRQMVRCVRYLPDPTDPRSLEFPDVSAILEDRMGALWIGTAGGGLSRLDDDGFHRLGSADGLTSDGVRGMVEDDDGSLWISTRRGLIRYDPVRGRTMKMGLVDGLPSVDFYHGTASRGRDRLYFGTPKGLVIIPAGTPFPDPAPSPTVFTSIRNLKGPVPAKRPPFAMELLQVPYGEVLSFEFAVLDFDTANRHRYAYWVAGITDEWIDLEGRRDITFTDLSPGSYTLRIKGRNAQGVWSESSVDLQVVPPFWLTGWFRMGGLAVVAMVAFGLYRWRFSALERRTRDQQILTRRLEAARENERKRIARELHDEMGQVLSAAKISLQTLSDLPNRAARHQRIEDLVGLVDRILKQVRSIALELSPPYLDEVGLKLALDGYLSMVAKRSMIEIQVETAPDLNSNDSETSIHIFRLVQESITNVVRHADSSQVKVRLLPANGSLEISIRDNGRGFEVDEVLRRSVQGQHLGLLGMRERARSIGGEMTIDSRPGHGTEIRIRIPWK